MKPKRLGSADRAAADRATARRVCDNNLWLASIVLCPHLALHQRLAACAAVHCLHAAGFHHRSPKRSRGPSQPQQPSPKRAKLHHRRHHEQQQQQQQDDQEQQQQDDQQQQDQGQELRDAAQQGDEQQLRRLCQQPGRRVDVNQAADRAGSTPLHAAAACGSAACCRLLLDQGADAYALDHDGATPLMLAAAGGHAEALKVLLDAGADAFMVDAVGRNALFGAASCGSLPCLELLLAEGVDPDYANTDLGAGEHALLLAAEAGRGPVVRRLLQAGAKVNRTDAAGHTALWMAASRGHADVVALLLAEPHVKHIRVYDATTPLQAAQASGDSRSVWLIHTHLQQQQREREQQ